MTENAFSSPGAPDRLGRPWFAGSSPGRSAAPTKIIVFSRDEAKQHAMRSASRHAAKATDDVYYENFDQLIEFQIGDVRDYASVERAVRRSDVVFHAAAMKQVPTCEYFPSQAVATNIGGAENVVRAVSLNSHVTDLVVVSTDKACRPINVMVTRPMRRSATLPTS